jgi:cleavage stimulation factor subunit 3
MPPAAAHLNTLLPPPMYFHGPFVAVDKLMEIFQRLILPNETAPPTGEGCDPAQFDIAKSVHWVVNQDPSENPSGNHHHHHHHGNHGGGGGGGGYHNNQEGGRGGGRGGRRGAKRKMGNYHNQHHDSEDEDSSVQPPANDIYRVRQQKRVK